MSRAQVAIKEKRSLGGEKEHRRKEVVTKRAWVDKRAEKSLGGSVKRDPMAKMTRKWALLVMAKSGFGRHLGRILSGFDENGS